ncbi:MAG: DUF6624 domain-containing protein [Patescibacteria group bacterium]|nr:hypothetical protein [Patescibacteria group bacterium]MBU1953140.1 hypothetical protein [Patescibacteria group bacterium]
MSMFLKYVTKLQLLCLLKKDQRARKNPDVSISEEQKVDYKNTEALKKIISRVGWPTISKVGERAAHAAWIIAQHTKDGNFREKCLNLMKENSEDVSRKDLAFLEDRVSLANYGYQIYGTQVKTEERDGKLITEIMPVKDDSKLEDLRRKMGLDPLEEQLRRCEKMYKELLVNKK